MVIKNASRETDEAGSSMSSVEEAADVISRKPPHSTPSAMPISQCQAKARNFTEMWSGALDTLAISHH